MAVLYVHRGTVLAGGRDNANCPQGKRCPPSRQFLAVPAGVVRYTCRRVDQLSSPCNSCKDALSSATTICSHLYSGRLDMLVSGSECHVCARTSLRGHVCMCARRRAKVYWHTQFCFQDGRHSWRVVSVPDFENSSTSTSQFALALWFQHEVKLIHGDARCWAWSVAQRTQPRASQAA
jgi:hypothetical protein